LDVTISDSKVILIEIKSYVNSNGVVIFKRKIDLYSKVTGKSIDRKIIVTPFIYSRSKDMCIKHGIDVYTSKNIQPYYY